MVVTETCVVGPARGKAEGGPLQALCAGEETHLNDIGGGSDHLRFRLLIIFTPLHVPVFMQFALARPHIFEQYCGDEL